MRFRYRLLIYSGIGYGCLCAWFYATQRNLIYYPIARSESESLQTARLYGMEPWRGTAGEVRGWVKPARSALSQRWLVFHGNAGSALEREDYIAGLQQGDPGREVILIEYPGYDCRPGAPTERALLGDARSAITEWSSHPEPLYLLGESLGGALAVEAAAASPGKVQGLILLTPLPDLVAVGRRHFRWLPVRWLVKDRYAAQRAAASLRIPAFFGIAGQDEIVPTDLGESFYTAYPGPKAVWREPKAGHNDIEGGPEAAWWPEAEDLLARGVGDGEGRGRPRPNSIDRKP